MAASFASLHGVTSYPRITSNVVRSTFSQPRLRAMSSLLSEVTKPGSAHETPAMMHRFDSRSSAIALAMASSLPNTTSGSTPLMVGIHPFVPEYVVVDVQSHASIAVGVDLHADAAHLAASQHQRRGRGAHNWPSSAAHPP